MERHLVAVMGVDSAHDASRLLVSACTARDTSIDVEACRTRPLKSSFQIAQGRRRIRIGSRDRTCHSPGR